MLLTFCLFVFSPIVVCLFVFFITFSLLYLYNFRFNTLRSDFCELSAEAKEIYSEKKKNRTIENLLKIADNVSNNIDNIAEKVPIPKDLLLKIYPGTFS